MREPYDAAARDRGLAAELAEWCGRHSALHVIDLGSGTGSLGRWLAPRLACYQQWTLVEHDPALIAAGSALLPHDAGWRYERADLAASLAEILARPAQLVTASALLDLVSQAWAERLVQAVVGLHAALYVTLTYDGVLEFEPDDPLDDEVCRWVNRHQRSDKGFGPALGPDGTDALRRCLEPHAGRLMQAHTPWRLGPEDRSIQEALLQGWAGAALETMPERAGKIEGWHARRLALLAGGLSSCRVGHLDLLWLPEGGPPFGFADEKDVVAHRQRPRSRSQGIRHAPDLG
jgi:hypothetical protein